MRKRKRKPISDKKMQKKIMPATYRAAERALEKIAKKEGTTVEQIRKHIQIAMLSGLLSEDPAIKDQWEQIPTAGEVATPEEVVAYCADKMLTM